MNAVTTTAKYSVVTMPGGALCVAGGTCKCANKFDHQFEASTCGEIQTATDATMQALAEFSRTDLTAYETEQLQAARAAVKAQSLAVGSFVFRSGNPDYLEAAADLYLDLLTKLTEDADIRTGALGYGLFLAMGRANDRQASQAAQLQGEFLTMLFKNAIADRAGAKVGA